MCRKGSGVMAADQKQTPGWDRANAETKTESALIVGGKSKADKTLSGQRAAKTPPDRLEILFTALGQLSEECGHRNHALGGFAVLLVNVLEQGLGVQP